MRNESFSSACYGLICATIFYRYHEQDYGAKKPALFTCLNQLVEHGSKKVDFGGLCNFGE